MKPSDRTLERILAAVADRLEVDWDAEAAARPELRRTLQTLRVLQGIDGSSGVLTAPEGVATSPSSETAAALGKRRAAATPVEARSRRPRQRPRTWGSLEILERIGRGGFGELFRAYDPRLQIELTLKLALPRRGRGPDTERLLAEARGLARVRHPNVLAVYGADEHDGRAGIWTELVRGRTLEELLQRQGPFDPAEAAAVGIDVCRALAALHAAALVHGDVKTSNVMREHGGRVVLLDFGAVTDTARSRRESSRLGTPAFMAPEVLRDSRASARSDLYGLGILLYRLVSGATPFQANSVAELMRLHEQGSGVPLAERRPDLPAVFVAVVERARALEAEERFPNALAMERALAEWLRAAPDGDAVSVSTTLAPASSGAVTTHDLPRPITSFVGRVEETTACADLLAHARLVTILGPGGSGKTRLALHVAEQVFAGYTEARFVDLAPVDGGRAAQAVGAAFGVREGGGRRLIDQVADRIGGGRVLLVLDGCEHGREDACPLVEELCARCRGLTVLATSREALGLAEEHRYVLPPLALPEAPPHADAHEVYRADSARLFIERARAVRPDFRLSDDVAGAVARICRRLEGIPLAVELAAARLRLLSVEDLERLLEHRFRLLTESPFSSSPRHRTLRAALDWSYEHLDEAERRVLRRLSVFSAGWTLAGAVYVDRGELDELSLVDVLARLVDKSLVVVDGSIGPDSRFRMLDTIREFAGERLATEDDAPAAFARHAAFYGALAERAEPMLWGVEQATWAERLEAEHRDLLLALDWSARNDPARGLALAGALGRFWVVHAHLTVGRDALRTALAASPYVAPHPDAARAAYAAGVLAAFQADPEDARVQCTRGLEAYRALGDRLGEARALVGLGLVAHIAEDFMRAGELYAGSLEIYRTLREPRGTAMVLNNLGGIAWREGRWKDARALHEEALVHGREIGDSDVLALALTNLAFIAIQDGRREESRRRLLEALARTRDVGLRRNGAAVVETAAALLATCYESARSIRLYTAAAAARAVMGVPMDAAWRDAHVPLQRRIARDLGVSRLAIEERTGHGLSLEAAVDDATQGLELLGPLSSLPRPRSRDVAT